MVYPKPGAGSLRKGRYSQSGHYYFLTTSISGRRKIFYRGGTPLPQEVPLPQQDRAIIVLDAIRWLHESDRFVVDAAVVMPDHLHLVGKLGGGALDKVMHSLKSFSAHRLVETGVEAPVWQDGYHDHGLRDHEDYRIKVQYVLENPVRAGLAGRVEDYPYVILPDWWG